MRIIATFNLVLIGVSVVAVSCSCLFSYAISQQNAKYSGIRRAGMKVRRNNLNPVIQIATQANEISMGNYRSQNFKKTTRTTSRYLPPRLIACAGV